MAMTNEQLTKWIDEIFGTIDEIKQNSGDISGLTRSVRQLREDLTATQEDVSDLEDQTAGTVSLAKAPLQYFTDGSATQALDLVADIIPVQAGSGDPSPTNVRAITGYSSVTASAAGKNIVNIADSTGVTSQTLIGDEHLGDGYFTVSATVKCNNTIKAGITVNGVQCFVDSQIGERVSVSIDTGEIKIYAAGSAVGYNVDITDIQIEHGTTATTYEPYQANTATITPASTVYSGNVDFTTGALAEDMAVVDLGSLEWTYLPSVHGFNANFPANSGAVKPKGLEGFCEIYKNYADSENPNYEDFITQSYAFWANANDLAQVKKIWIMDDRYTSAEDFTTAMSGVKLCYKLASISTTTLTPAQLQLLQGENNVSATSGPIALTYAPDNVLAEVYAYIQKRFDTLTASLAATRTTKKTTKTLTKKED